MTLGMSDLSKKKSNFTKFEFRDIFDQKLNFQKLNFIKFCFTLLNESNPLNSIFKEINSLKTESSPHPPVMQSQSVPLPQLNLEEDNEMFPWDDICEGESIRFDDL